MMRENVIFHEQYGINGDLSFYERQGPNSIFRYKKTSTLANYWCAFITFLKEIVLPHGYPNSVSQDYLEYQVWDTIQAFCSTITSAFTTRAVLKGVGVGNAQATALSATVAWILKDGTGMIGRILFAWWKGCALDNDCKKWRFVADIINDLAMSIELLLPFFEDYALLILCLTSLMKSIVGVAGGATRASITHHQAVNNNMAEISAIDGTQETIVNLMASLLSIVLLNWIHDYVYEMALVVTLILIHLFANYNAVKALVFKKFNKQRLNILLRSYYKVGIVLSIKAVNYKEQVLLGWGLTDVDLCGFKIQLGESLNEPLKYYKPDDCDQIFNCFDDKNFIVVPDIKNGIMYIGFEKLEKNDILESYFYASLLALALCIYFDGDKEFSHKRYLHQSNPQSRLSTFMKNHQRREHSHKIPSGFYSEFRNFFNGEWKMFHTFLELQEWNQKSYDISMNDWRIQWKSYVKKNT